MKKKLIISVAFIITVIIVLLVINKQSKQSELVVDNILTNQINRTEIKIQPRKHEPQIFESEKFSTNTSLFLKDEFINFSQFTNIVLNISDYSYRRKQRILNNVVPKIFHNSNKIQLTNLVDLTIQGAINDSTNVHHPFLDTLCILRFHKLLPYMANKILENSKNISKIKDAEMCMTWLGHIQHPDTLRTHLELNRLLTKDSPLRKDRRWAMKWTDNLPVILRDDCLPIYLEITRNPEKYNLTEWRTAHGALLRFTNDIAVTEYKKGIKNIQKVHKNLHPLIIRDMHSRIKYQNDFCTGKIPLLKRPKPLLDE